MSVVYVTEQGARIQREGGRLVIRKGRQLLGSFAWFEVEQVVVFGNITVTPPALSLLLKNGIDTVLLSASGGYRGRLVGAETKNIVLRRIQFQKHDDVAFRIGFARSVVAGKIANMRTLLARAARRRTADLSGTLHRLRLLREEAFRAGTADVLRGIEGAGTAAYFEGYRTFFPSALQFERRTRRPPKDPVNAMLSFGYALLASSVESAVCQVGLDPYLGFFHVVDYGRPSLVLDLMEEFRPVIVDSVVLDMTAHHLIGEDGFEKRDGGVYLAGEGRQRFIKRYHDRIGTTISYPTGENRVEHIDYRRCFELQARRLVRTMKGEVPSYVPFAIK